MNINASRIKKYIRRMEAVILAIIIAVSQPYTVAAADGILEQETFVGHERSSDLEEIIGAEDPGVEYSLQTNAGDYKIKLEAYDGVFPKGEELKLFATQIDNQDILDAIDSKLSAVCEGEFNQISFDIKVLNAVGEELQPDRSKYIENEDIVPIKLTIGLADDEKEMEREVFHFSDDLSSMECLVSTVNGDEIFVEPEHFSVFTILESDNGSYYNSLTPPTGYRTYIEWMPNSTAGLRRLQKIYVYAKAGEQISFGSSSFLNLPKAEVETSLKDSFGYSVGTAADNASIAVTLPYDSTVMQEKKGVTYQIYGGSVNPSDVITQIQNSTSYSDKNIYLFKKEEISDVNTSTKVDAEGTIYNWQQEELGAKNDNNLGGYVPISFTAPVTGVYTFRFFGTQYTKVETAPKAKKTDTFPQLSKNYVGAWDITVTKSNTDPTPITGRTFTDALIWTIGANVSSNEHILDESVYALTSDGFEYKVDFNGLDPFGFVFYTNKRGLLVSSDDHEDGHYRSLARSVKSKRNQLDDLVEMGVHLNSIPTTSNDESYFITFEKADTDLLQHYTKHPDLADNDSIGTNKAAYKDFNFKGLNSSEDHKGTEGYGGYFSFKYDTSLEPTDKILPSTYEIIINFTGNETLENEYGYAAGKHNEVILSNTLVDGENKIFWDGKDEYGNVVIGNSSGIEYNIVSFNVKAGEVHFPLLDVENNRYGIKIEMQNNLSDVNKSQIYYDNSDSDVYGKNIGDKKEALSGMSSTSGAMAFSSNAGDYCAIDIWADYKVATPLNETYSFTLYGFSNDKAFFNARTEWEYFYTTMDGSRHFDASSPLPNKAEVVLQYRIVDKNTAGIGGINKESDDWQKNDTGAGKDWQYYTGDVKVTLQDTDSTTHEKTISLDPAAPSSFDKDSEVGTYKSVTIHSYRSEENSDPLTKPTCWYESSEGLCVFNELPLHPADPDDSTKPDLSKFYQYRVVDISNTSLESYIKDEVFDRVVAVDVPEGAGHITKDIYLEETLEYRYRGAAEFNLEFDQLWNDSAMSTLWVNKHRPKAVKVAVLYGIPLYEDVDKETEYDITTEKGYYGEDVDIVWRKIQQIDYLTLYEDGAICKDSKGVNRNLSLVTSGDESYSAYFPVWKYMSNGDPYFYKIRPISYSMDGTNFSDIEYVDVNNIVPKLSLPELYGKDANSDDDTNKKYGVVFYDEEVEKSAGKPTLYPRAAKFTDVPECAEIEVTKTDASNNPIIGKTASYEITNKDGKNLMFTLDSEGKYTYQGLDGTAGLPEGVTKVIKTSTLDSIVHAKELPLHEYSIREVAAPEGYQLGTSSINVVTTDYLFDSSISGGYKTYLCKKSQQNSLIQGSDGDPDADPSPSSQPDTSLTIVPIPMPGNGAEKLPQTGGLTGSLVGVILGIIMIAYGRYLIKTSKKRRNNKD